MAKFLVKKQLGGGKAIMAENGGSIAGFACGPEGEEAFGYYVAGFAKGGHLLFDEDRGEFLVGDVGRLVEG